MDIALIFGVTGQSGSYLAEELLNRGYQVIGVRRRNATGSMWRLQIALSNINFQLVEGDVTDLASIINLLQTYKPNVVYNAAATSHVHTSFNQPLATWKVTAEGHLNILEGIRQILPVCQIVFFASSEMFGGNCSLSYYPYLSDDTVEISLPYTEAMKWTTWHSQLIQNENTKFSPQSPYSIAKLAAFNATKLYRESYNMQALSGIMFNKESPRRGINFVTRKITAYFHYLKNTGFRRKLQLGNLNSYRDWSYVPDIMRGLVDLAESGLNNDYVFATGETHTIKDFLDEVGKLHGLDWKEYVEINPSLMRPAEVNYLCGDATKAKQDFGWEPKVKFHELVKIMVDEENGLE